jgi:hypothetical protein
VEHVPKSDTIFCLGSLGFASIGDPVFLFVVSGNFRSGIISPIDIN